MRPIVLVNGDNLVYGIRHLYGNDGNKSVSAFIAAKKLEAKLMHASYETRHIYVYALTKASDITRTITFLLVQKYKA
jgi:hypothetical protein